MPALVAGASHVAAGACLVVAAGALAVAVLAATARTSSSGAAMRAGPMRVATASGAAERASGEAGETVGIEPAETALTFARIGAHGGRRVIAVTGYTGGRVEGVDLSVALGRAVSDPITAFLEEGYDSLLAAIERAGDVSRLSVPAVSLAIPVDLGDHHIAAGTNYPEHGDEAGVEDGPFLFAKLVRPTPSRAGVPAGDALLDYEVELAWVTLEPLARGEKPRALGVILCNDYTDRALLLRHVDPWDVPSGKGFTTGKSRPGYLPVGDLFVIPRDPRAFAAARVLRLEVNGELRQRSPVAAQVWDLDRLLDETWRRAGLRWDHAGAPVALLPGGAAIPARTLLLSGTPAGTVFQRVPLRHQASGLAAWLLGGWRRPLVEHVARSYASDPRERARYLRPGDRVLIRVDGLGVIDNRIVR